ncbi:NAD-dependent epimerase/dehydratase family protein [Acetobacteraceae bacterium KSS8]|uniref:NAD-dependent epimerase/dehydratase family protein n=1 Tax=Endosaccharibacter trunci TaxID=2812733 RepID=A0ABT1WBP9_9PROT|nr:NAD-dependent epimerase/dehydratase family protein [Acetobacteraceae bacterium KSS8]
MSGDTPRCLVLGAGGFIGTNLCLALRARGIPATGFGRTAAPPPILHGLPWKQGDIGTLPDPDALVAGHTHLFDLIAAGLPGQSEADPAGIVADGMPPRIRLLAACRRQGVARIVFASSGGTVYGPSGDLPIREDAPTDPISAYGIGKLAVEKYLRLFHHQHGLDHRILRIGNAYGPFQHPERGQGLVAAVLNKLRHDAPIHVWGNGTTVRDYIHIDDVVSAILAAAFSDDPDTRLCNVGSGTGRDVNSVIRDAARILGREPRLIHHPGRSGDVPANILDATRLHVATGWQPEVGWEDGLARTARWLADSRE